MPPEPSGTIADPPIRVLLIEDSRNMQAALGDMLEAIGGYVVVERLSSELRGTEWLADHPGTWELAIVDLMLEEGSGFGLLRRCRQANAGGTIMVFSEFATVALTAKCINMGADVVFRKSELPAMVRYLETHAGRGEP